jgi:hypothetical protein
VSITLCFGFGRRKLKVFNTGIKRMLFTTIPNRGCMDGKGALKWVLVETRPTAAILCFWAKITTQNRVYDPYIKITFLPFKIAFFSGC